MTHYPIDDRVNGLTDDQKQLRETLFGFCQKELAPHAEAIDKNNDFPGQYLNYISQKRVATPN